MKHTRFISKDKTVTLVHLENGTYSVSLTTAKKTVKRIYKSLYHAQQRFEKYKKPLEIMKA